MFTYLLSIYNKYVSLLSENIKPHIIIMCQYSEPVWPSGKALGW